MGLWQQPRKTELIGKKKFENSTRTKSIWSLRAMGWESKTACVQFQSYPYLAVMTHG